MTRRAAAGLSRLLPLLLIAAAVLVVAGAALTAACGGSSGVVTPESTTTSTVTASASGPAEPTPPPSTSPTEAPAQTTVRLCFLRGDKLGVAERSVAKTAAVATASLKALFAGPTPAEQAAGLTTALAPGIRVNSLSINGGVARVDVTSEFWESGDGLAEAGLLPAAQIVTTLTRFPTVKRVAIRVDDEPFPAAGGPGSPSRKWRRRDFVDFEPAIFVETPGVGAVLSSPFLLSGTASVFEGSFQARLVDSSGRRVVNVILQAGEGAPGRGRFSRDVPFSTSARRGTLIVFDQSMEDGSRQDEVRIPVTFAID